MLKEEKEKTLKVALLCENVRWEIVFQLAGRGRGVNKRELDDQLWKGQKKDCKR